MRRPWLLLALTACDPTAELTADDVITTLAASPASLPANGAATAAITVATAPDPKPGTKVTLTVAGATWAGVTGARLETELGPDGTTTALLTASRTPGPARVIAEIAGYQREIEVALVAAEVASFTHRIQGQLAADRASEIAIAVQPVVAGGLPSAGTTVAFTLAPTPAATAYLTAPTLILDASAASAATTVIAAPSTTRLDVTVAITPPGGATVSGPIAIERLP